MPHRTPPRRLRRWVIAIAVGTAVLLALVLGSARIFLHGDDLGDFVAGMLNRKMRGRIEIGAIEWPMSSIPTMISGGWVPVTVRDVRLWDDCMQSAEGRRARSIAGSQPSSAPGAVAGTQLFVVDLPCAPDNRRVAGLTPRKKLLDTAEITAEIDVHSLFFGNHDLVFRNIRVHGGEVLLEQSAEPYPLHDYDKTTISLISAFQPRMKAGFRAGIFADKAPPVFDLRDLHLEKVGLTYHHRPEFGPGGRARYPITLRVENVEVDAAGTAKNAFLYADNSDPLVGKLYMSIPITAGPGTLRIDDEGPAEDFEIGPLRREQKERRKPRYVIDITSVDVRRLAQLPRRWLEGDPIARTLELDLTATTAQGGTIDVDGELKNYWDRPFDGTWALDVVATNLGPTVTASIDPALSGDAMTAKLWLRGPFIANPRIEYEASGLEYETLRPKEPLDPPALRLGLAKLKGQIDLVNDQGYLEETIAQVLGDDGAESPGKIRLDATFGLKPYQVNNADIKILEAIDLGRFIPESARRHLGRFVRGDLSGNGDTTSGFALRNIDLVIGHSPTDLTARLYGGRIFTTDNFSTLQVAREQPLRARVGKTSATISGSILARTRWLKVKLANVESPDLGQWLRRLGVAPLATSASDGTVEIVGPATAPAIDASALLAGIPMLGQAQLATRFENNVLDITRVQSGSLGGALAGSGRIRVAPGKAPYVEKLTVTGQRLSAEKMAAAGGLLGKASGTIDKIELSASGSLDKRQSALDWLDLVDAFIQADRLTVAGDVYDDIGVCVTRSTTSRQQCRRRDDARADADEAACAEARKKGGTCVLAHASRQDGGDLDLLLSKIPGELLARGKRGPSELGGTIDISALPLRILDRLAGPGTFGGTVAARLTIDGTSASPSAIGDIELLRGWAKGAFFGDSKLHVTPVGRSLSISGTALGGRLTLRATLGTAAPYPLELVITGRRIELDPLVPPELMTRLPFPVRGWASGEIRVNADLSPVPAFAGGTPRQPEAWIQLSELEVIGDYRDGDQLSPLRLVALPTTQRRAPVSMRLTPTSFQLVCPTAPAQPDAPPPALATPPSTTPTQAQPDAVSSADPAKPAAASGAAAGLIDGRHACPVRIATPAGIITVQGSGTLDALDFSANGTLDLALLAQLFPQFVDELSGTLVANAALVGPAAAYELRVELEPNQVSARPTGLETVVRIPTGNIKLANNSVGFTGVRVLVDDTHIGEGSELTIGGGVKMTKDGLPQWGVILTGKIAGKLLQAAAPQKISQASGLAIIDQSASLNGIGWLPQISATLLFDPERPLTIIPRGFRRELTLQDGTLDLESGPPVGISRTYEITFNDVSGAIDSEGTVSNLSGSVAILDARPADPIHEADLRLDVDSIPFRVPGTLDLLLTGRNLHLTREPGRPLHGEGIVEVVNGKFLRDFDFTDLLRPRTPPGGLNRPFWEEVPMLGNAELSLRIDVRQMAVENNIADIDLAGPLLLTGTARDPRINGSILVQRGTFRMQGTRAKFTRTNGTVEFSPAKRFPADTPTLNIVSEADYRDPTGRDHLITLNVNGTVFAPTWDLRTSTGYNKSQTFALIFFGRTPDQVRQSIGDSAVGTDPTRIDPTTNPSAGAADQLIKDFAGNWVSLLLGNSLEQLTGLDVLRFQVDFGSIGIRGEKKVFENVTSVFELEQTVRGSTVNASVELRTPFRVTLTGAYLNKNFDSEAEEDIRDRQLKLVYRFFIP